MPIVIEDDPRIERKAREQGFNSAQEFVESVVVEIIESASADGEECPRATDLNREERLAAWERLRRMARPLSEHVDYRRESFYPEAGS